MTSWTTDEEAFLNAIRAQPADDAARLVYADWLDEHGQTDRAEFIRVQCELARLPHWKDRLTFERLEELRRREEELLDANYTRWTRAFVGDQPTNPDERRIFFKRGFAAAYVLASQRIMREWQAMFTEPCLRELAVIGIHEDDFTAILRDPRCAELSRLAVSYGFEGTLPRWRDLAEYQYFDRLEELSFGYGGAWTDEDAVAIGQNAALVNVKTLHLDVGEHLQRAEAILSGVAFRQLRRFRLNAYRQVCSQAILRSAGLACLEKLDLHLWLDAAALDGLATAPFWPTLQELSIWNAQLDDTLLRRLGQTPAPALTSIELTGNVAANPMHVVGPVLAQVNTLTFHDVALVDAQTIRRLIDIGYSQQLYDLTLLSCPKVDDEVALLLASRSEFGNLHALDVRKTSITERGFHAIAESPTLTKLVDVTVDADQLTPAAQSALLARFGAGLLLPYWRR